LLLYNLLYKNIINYYSFVRNRHKLDSWLYKLLSSSCNKLLASKFSLSSQKKVISKFGPSLINRPLPTHDKGLNGSFGLVIKRFSSNKVDTGQTEGAVKFNLHAYIAGFIDAEGNFYIKVVKSSAMATGYSVQLTPPPGAWINFTC
jgi:hypothetical protein